MDERYTDWEKYEGMVRSICNHFWKKYSYFIISYEDLLQTCRYLLLMALGTFREGRMNKDRYIYHYITLKLKAMLFNGEYAPSHNNHPFTCAKERKQATVYLVEDETLDLYESSILHC